MWIDIWLVVSTHLKKIPQIGSFPQIGMKIKNSWNHHLDIIVDLFGVLKMLAQRISGFTTAYNTDDIKKRHLTNLDPCKIAFKRELEVFFFDHWHSMFSLCKKIRVQITTNFPNRFQTPELTGEIPLASPSFSHHLSRESQTCLDSLQLPLTPP